MQKFFKENYIHLVAILLFVVAIYLFIPKAFEGELMNQHDTTSWRASSKNSFDYNDKYGKFPLWNPTLFSGLPNYLIAFAGESILPNFHKLNTLGLPDPAGLFVLAALCFYLFCMAFGINRYWAIAASIVYSLCTYNIVVTAAGHQTKMLAIAYMPAVLAGLQWLFNKKYAIGALTFCYFFMLQVGSNHLQITYYLGYMLAFFVLYKIVDAIKNKTFGDLIKPLAIAGVAAAIGIAINISTIMVTNEYSKYSIRGESNVKVGVEKNKAGVDTLVIKDSVSKGLGFDYAFDYSQGKAELLTFLMPNAFGGRTRDQSDQEHAEEDVLGFEHPAVAKVDDLSVDNLIGDSLAIDPRRKEELKKQLKDELKDYLANSPKYWGMVGLTNGPWYAGTLICLLAIIGFTIKANKNKWWLLATIVFGLVLAMGSNLIGVNKFLFNTLPLLNKFRAPATALFVSQLAILAGATFAVQALLEYTVLNKEKNVANDSLKDFIKNNALFKNSLIAVGSVVAFIGIYYFAGDFSSEGDKAVLDSLRNKETNTSIGGPIVKEMIASRKSMFLDGWLRVVLFAAIVLAAVYALAKNLVNKNIVLITLGVIAVGDMFMVSKRYINDERFSPKEVYEGNEFTPNKAEEEVLKDKDPNFRVYNAMVSTFSDSKPSYFYKNIGGYHAAKLKIYNDVITAYLSNPIANINVINMLNAKYFIFNASKDPRQAVPMMQPNPDALGNCWFVKQVTIIDSSHKELLALKGLNTKDSAVIAKADAAILKAFTYDSTAKITQTKFNNDEIQYESNTTSTQFAVFSEIYYPAGWKAYIDGAEAPIAKTNYILRGLMVPAGKHNITFKFEPETVAKGNKLNLYAGILFYAFLAACLFSLFQASSAKKK
jgi:hypothetical protein